MWKALAFSREWKPFLAAGALVGVVGVGVFGLVHAVIIVPIWSKLLGGIPFGVGAGLVMGWAFWELGSGGRWRATAGGGFAFGLLMWVTLIPMTAFGAVVRATGIHGMDNVWETVVECLLAFGTGVLSGASLADAGVRRSRRGVQVLASPWRWAVQSRSRTAPVRCGSSRRSQVCTLCAVSSWYLSCRRSPGRCGRRPNRRCSRRRRRECQRRG